MAEFDAGLSASRLPEQFGKYSLLGHLATGGMAEVYLARQTGLQGFEKIVVIKCVRGELEEDMEATAQFLDEARLVATLEHPNIAQVHEIGLVNNSYFFVMEYVHGADLRQLMEVSRKRKQPVSLADAVYIASHVCAALHCAHEKLDADGHPLEIIHRDVSPSNVLLSYDGAVKLCDFGIAKAQNRSIETQRGVLKGKYSYMSPEQCRCLALDRRSDVFSMGILLYELTTLTRLFNAASDFELLQAIVEQPVTRPSTRVRDYPPELERIVLRALEKDPAQRYQTAQEMQLDLETFARENKLPQSSIHIATLIGSLFEKRKEPWSSSTTMPVPLLVAEGTGDERPGSEAETETAALGNLRRAHETPLPRRTPSARGSNKLIALGSEEHTPVSRVAPAAVAPPPPKRSPSALWLVAAAVCAVAGGAVMFAAGDPHGDADPTQAAALDAAADRLASTLEQSTRSAHMRADGISAAPILRTAIGTDAMTMKDVVTNEYAFTPAKNEVIEIFRLQGGVLVSLARLPATARPLQPLKGGETRVESTPQGPTVVAGAPILGNDGKVAGVLAVAMPVDLASSRRGLAGHVSAAWIDGFGGPIALTGAAPLTSAGSAALAVPLPANSDWNPSGASLRALPMQTSPTSLRAWQAPVRFAAFGAAGLLLALYGLGWARRRA